MVPAGKFPGLLGRAAVGGTVVPHKKAVERRAVYHLELLGQLLDVRHKAGNAVHMVFEPFFVKNFLLDLQGLLMEFVLHKGQVLVLDEVGSFRQRKAAVGVKLGVVQMVAVNKSELPVFGAGDPAGGR